MSQRWTRGIAGALLFGCLLLGLAACGKKGPPVPPGPPDKITWPRSYPTH